jgi:hypothetical protein
METIHETGGKFQSISEPWANTTTHVGKMIMTVFAGIAEFERDLIRDNAAIRRKQYHYLLAVTSPLRRIRSVPRRCCAAGSYRFGGVEGVG